MDASFIPEKILNAFGFSDDGLYIRPFGSGLINHTWKLTSGNKSFILQQINTQVFKSPEAIAANLQQLDLYLKTTAPDYLFTAPISTLSGKFLVQDEEGKYFRLFPFVNGSHSVNAATNPAEAFEAAKQFGKFTRLLKDFNPNRLQATITGFHNLGLRYQEFQEACRYANSSRKKMAKGAIETIEKQIQILKTFKKLVLQKQVPVRVVHHDTKINNVLFNEAGKGLCVVDLDTVMPGYFLSDVGDMLRTYLSPVDEEEGDFNKIIIREEYYQAVYKGYMSEME